MLTEQHEIHSIRWQSRGKQKTEKKVKSVEKDFPSTHNNIVLISPSESVHSEIDVEAQSINSS
jgi:hypothetical protein